MPDSSPPPLHDRFLAAAREIPMNPTLTSQVHAILNAPVPRPELVSEGPLRVAASTLSGAPQGAITATTVVGVLGRDDAEAFRTLVRDIADEYGLDARVTVNVGSFSVRFERCLPA
jgi:hypothetical protein